jgi:hypothetical protein
MVPTTNAPARRTKVWAVVLIIVLAAVATGVAFLIIHLTKKKEGAPGNWTETQIDTMTNALLVFAPMQLKEIMAIEDLRAVLRCAMKEISLKHAYDDECFKARSCNDLVNIPALVGKCLGGGEKGRWSAAAKDFIARAMEKTKGAPRVVALCAVDAISNSYSFSDALNGKASAPSTELLSNIMDSCSLKGDPVDGLTGSFMN